MSWLNLGIICVAFFVLYRYIVPWLFPDVVSGQQKLKSDADLLSGAGGTGGKEYIVQHGNMGLFGGQAGSAGAEKRSHLRARRRANANDASSV
jgi:hypothetical protein